MRLLVIGIVSCMLAALGVRLLRLARRHRARPELWLGLAFASAAASTALIPFAAGGMLPVAASLALAFTAQGGLSVTLAFFGAFTWRVFRPQSGAARVLAPALIAANLAGGFAFWWSGTPLPTGRIGLCVLLVRIAVLLWLFAESALYAQRMRRRARLGLAEPLVANRFTLWAIWTGALALIPLVSLILRVQGVLVAAPPGEPLAPAMRIVLSALGAGGGVAAVACWLAFFPPAAYRRWIASRHAAPGI